VRADDRVLLLAPHPDDETLAAAGLLQHAAAAGAAVRVIYATDGENNPWAQRAVEHRWRVSVADRFRWGARRRREALAALAILGVPDHAVIFLGLPDQGLTRELLHGDCSAIASLACEIERFMPTVLVAPSPFDLHPDHSALAVLVRFARGRVAPRFRWPLLLDYLVHNRGGATQRFDGSWRVTLTYQQLVRKRVAIRAHCSQLVLRKRGLLAFATRHENFFSTEKTGAEHQHPVRAALVDGQTLRLHLQQTAHLGAFGGTTLYAAIDRREGSGRWCVRLPRASGNLELASGIRVVSAVIEEKHGGRELRLPLEIFGDATSIFVKLERRFGFFDEAGWCEIPLSKEVVGGPAPPDSAPARPSKTWATPSKQGALRGQSGLSLLGVCDEQAEYPSDGLGLGGRQQIDRSIATTPLRGGEQLPDFDVEGAGELRERSR
jgi:LmbE family N-acetylglucosaminyl deacetylase